ncbi:dephospho-CoA kinase [Actinotignum sp. GS-2025e]|uniref:dephospho-CoA kinase n=1 Tax=Actinotignum sp. GS-2025e TaxID=3427278 RepID=UPI003F460039
MNALTIGGASAQLLRPFTRPRGRALRIAVSGGIGAGKSTVTHVLRDRGAIIADADALAREITAPGSPVLAQLTAAFGPDILNDDGALNRAALAAHIFTNPAARHRLEALTHPAIIARARDILASAAPGQLAVYDVPLLVETRADREVDCVMIVAAPEEKRIEHLRGRGMSQADAQARMRNQVDDEARRALAHIWIWNAGSRAELENLVAQCAESWLAAATSYNNQEKRK